ncbi:MAG: hydrogenase maturation protease [Bryobacteraceae bacterium]
MPGVLIIGYGNPLRGDDGLGRRAAELLGGLAVHQLTPELAEPVSAADLVIFIDAAEGGPPGQWQCREIAASAPAGRAFTHHVDPAALVEAAALLYGRAPRALLFTMFGESFGYEEGLSAAVEAALNGMLDAVHQMLANSAQ